MDPAAETYSELLGSFLLSRGVWHRFIEFNEPVKTVDQAARKVDVEQIVKSIVLVDSNNTPLLVILPAKNRISYRKVKALLSVKDVRLANEEEVLAYSGYPVGGVPPFNMLKRALVDREILKNHTAIAGGGDINKLVELHTKDIIEILKPTIADLTRE
ncbi:MAG TPA: YbaK/EbsC family protein [Candidatus Bathyarchaeia archaeon]